MKVSKLTVWFKLLRLIDAANLNINQLPEVLNWLEEAHVDFPYEETLTRLEKFPNTEVLQGYLRKLKLDNTIFY
jgi:hypothetical protein